MKHAKWLVCATVVLSFLPGCFAQKASFCTENDLPVFTCQLNNGKLASVCASPDLGKESGSLMYLYGTTEKPPEFSLPKDPVTFRQNVTISEINDKRTGEDDEFLRFRNGIFSYVVYAGMGDNFDVEGVAVFKGDQLLENLPCVKNTSDWRLVFNSMLSWGVPEEDVGKEQTVWKQLLPRSSYVHSLHIPAQTNDFVTLTHPKQLWKGVDAWPRIAHPSTPAEERINATLDRLNQAMKKSLIDCDVLYSDYRKEARQYGEHVPDFGDWHRTITVTMTGPRFLSMVSEDSYFCGGAHPDGGTRAMVFDLTTGNKVDWTKLIAKSAHASAFEGDGVIEDDTASLLVLPALKAMSRAKASQECKDVFEDDPGLAPPPYLIWPDAKSGRLIAEPFDLSHAEAGCADDLKLTPEQARKLGFDEAVLSAIAQAHQQTVAAHR